LTILTGKPLMI